MKVENNGKSNTDSWKSILHIVTRYDRWPNYLTLGLLLAAKHYKIVNSHSLILTRFHLKHGHNLGYSLKNRRSIIDFPSSKHLIKRINTLMSSVFIVISDKIAPTHDITLFLNQCKILRKPLHKRFYNC